MTVADFVDRVRTLAQIVPLSISSWGRTEAHNRAVGGVPNSYHLAWLAMDIVPDVPSAANLALLRGAAVRLGLEIIDEWASKSHWHVQPHEVIGG